MAGRLAFQSELPDPITRAERTFGVDAGFNFNNGWSGDVYLGEPSGYSPPGLYREGSRVHLRGSIMKPAGTVGNARMIDLLPVGFRPGAADTWTDLGPVIYVDRTDNLFYTSTITVGDNGHLSLVGGGSTGPGMKVPPTASECILTLGSISWQTDDPMPAFEPSESGAWTRLSIGEGRSLVDGGVVGETDASGAAGMLAAAQVILPGNRLLRAYISGDFTGSAIWTLVDLDNPSIAAPVVVGMAGYAYPSQDLHYLPDLDLVAMTAVKANGAGGGIVLLDPYTLAAVSSHDLVGALPSSEASQGIYSQFAYSPNRRNLYACIHDYNNSSGGFSLSAMVVIHVNEDLTMTRGTVRTMVGPSRPIYSRLFDKAGFVTEDYASGVQLVDPVTLVNSGALIGFAKKSQQALVLGSRVFSLQHGAPEGTLGLQVADLHSGGVEYLDLQTLQVAPTAVKTQANRMCYHSGRNLLILTSTTDNTGGTQTWDAWAVDASTLRLEDQMRFPDLPGDTPMAVSLTVSTSPVTGLTYAQASLHSADWSVARNITRILR